MDTPELRFHKDGSFRLMLVGDPHETDDYHTKRGRAQSADYLRLMRTALRRIRPDLVIFLGDCGNGDTPESLRRVLMTVTAPVREAQVPFAVVFGNHDGESGLPQSEHAALYKEMPGSLFQKSAYADEYGDYLLTVKHSEGDKDAFALWMMDSGNRSENENEYYACVRPQQIAWYEAVAADLRRKNGGSPLPAMVFQHIPVVEEYRLVKQVPRLRMALDAVPGVNGTEGRAYVADRKHTDFRGYLGEAPATPDVNSGQFDSWKKTGDVIAAFFGHDHMNDFTGTVDGIVLAQCKLAGFRPYGDGLGQGVRVVDLREQTPRAFGTEMRTYRELIGTKCDSLHGRVKWVHDRIGVKIDVFEKAVLPVLALGAAAAYSVLRLRGRSRRRKG